MSAATLKYRCNNNHRGCAVVMCQNTYYNSKGLSFFRFPKDPTR